MDEVKASHYHRPTQHAQRRPHELSRIIVCAACRRPLRVTTLGRAGTAYYQDTSLAHKLACAAGGHLSVKCSTVIDQFEEILGSVALPTAWRDVIAQRSAAQTDKDEPVEYLGLRRAALEVEHTRLVSAFLKGDITEHDLDTQMELIQTKLRALPIPREQDTEEMMQAPIAAGETLGGMVAYWMKATAEERRDLVWSLLTAGGLLYDLQRGAVVSLIPRPAVLPVLALGLEGTGCWEQREGILWVRSEHLPAKQVREHPHLPPPQRPSLTAEQQEEAIKRVQQGGSLRRVAQELGTSYETIRRLLKSRGIVLEPRAESNIPRDT